MALLVLMRHGQSIWNEKNIFTGWVDVPLSKQGVEEAIQGGERISHIDFSVIFTSTLMRAQMTAGLAMLSRNDEQTPVFMHPEEKTRGEWSQIYGKEVAQSVIPIFSAWQLNERMYGHLQGLNKEQTAREFGQEQVQAWRRSFDEPPPGGESLAMTAARVLPFFQEEIVPYLRAGQNVLIAAHGNSLRSILMDIISLSKEEILHVELVTGEPLIYDFKEGSYERIDLSR